MHNLIPKGKAKLAIWSSISFDILNLSFLTKYKFSGWIENNKEQNLWPQGAKKLIESSIIDFSFKGIGTPDTKKPEQKVL